MEGANYVITYTDFRVWQLQEKMAQMMIAFASKEENGIHFCPGTKGSLFFSCRLLELLDSVLWYVLSYQKLIFKSTEFQDCIVGII